MWSKKYRLPKDRTDVPAIVARTIQREANDGLFQGALIFDQAVAFTRKPEWQEFIKTFELQKRKDSGVSYVWCFAFLDDEHPRIFSNFSKYSWGTGSAIYVRRRVKEPEDTGIDESCLDRPTLVITAPCKATSRFELLIGSLRHTTIGLNTFGPMIQSMQEIMRADEAEMKKILAKEKNRVPKFDYGTFSMNFLDPKASFSHQILKMTNRIIAQNGAQGNSQLKRLHDALLQKPVKKLIDEFLTENNRKDEYIIIQVDVTPPKMIRFDMDWKILPNGDLYGSNDAGLTYTFERKSYLQHKADFITIRESIASKVQICAGYFTSGIPECRFSTIYDAWYRVIERIHEARYQVQHPNLGYPDIVFSSREEADRAMAAIRTRLEENRTFLEDAERDFIGCVAKYLPNDFDIESLKG